MKAFGERRLSKDGSPHVTDERFNTISHLLALIFAMIGSGWLIARASTVSPWHATGASLYALGLVSLFLFSTLHHGLDGGPKLESALRTLDYAAIFLLIGGTFSPLCLTVARSPLGWSVFGVVWVFCLMGLTLRAVFTGLPKWFTMTLYVGLGWVAVLLGPTLAERLGAEAVGWITAGGVLYTLGGVVYVREAPNPVPGRFGFHEIWHLFVMAGAGCHFRVLAAFWLP